jgi:transposase
VAKQLLWQEYKEATPNGLQYSQFCDRYLRWAKPLSATMRQAHRVGEKAFVDFSGGGLDLVHPATGLCQKAVLFLAVLGASNLTYAEPVLHQDLRRGWGATSAPSSTSVARPRSGCRATRASA